MSAPAALTGPTTAEGRDRRCAVHDNAPPLSSFWNRTSILSVGSYPSCRHQASSATGSESMRIPLGQVARDADSEQSGAFRSVGSTLRPIDTRRVARDHWVASTSMTQPEFWVVQEFNAAINSADLQRLEALMSPGHRFIDSVGRTVEGRAETASAWASFFESFPDYRNLFERIELISPGRVRIEGRSECSFEPLDGPARWYAAVENGLIAEWRVEDPAERS